MSWNIRFVSVIPSWTENRGHWNVADCQDKVIIMCHDRLRCLSKNVLLVDLETSFTVSYHCDLKLQESWVRASNDHRLLSTNNFRIEIQRKPGIHWLNMFREQGTPRHSCSGTWLALRDKVIPNGTPYKYIHFSENNSEKITVHQHNDTSIRASSSTPGCSSLFPPCSPPPSRSLYSVSPRAPTWFMACWYVPLSTFKAHLAYNDHQEISLHYSDRRRWATQTSSGWESMAMPCASEEPLGLSLMF